MVKIVLTRNALEQLGALDDAIDVLNQQKIKVLFEMLAIKPSAADLEKILAWELILVTVKDRQMAVQLNKLSTYIPNLKFVVREDDFLFTVMPGDKKRRVRKEG